MIDFIESDIDAFTVDRLFAFEHGVTGREL
jgi:hypothetical protein